MTRIALLSVTMALLFFSSARTGLAAPQTNPLGGAGGGPITGSLRVRVVHDGTTTPFVGAFVMAVPSAGAPFSRASGLTSATGEITFTDAGLQGPVSVTVGATGYRYFTLVAVDANDIVIPLKPRMSTPPAREVGDYVTGIDVNNGPINLGDGNVDMAFLLQALSLETLMAFDLEGLLGPDEVVDVLGTPFLVPSNIFVPQQFELFVEIRKDHYYLYLPDGQHTVCALSGRIPRDVLLAGGSMLDLIPALQWREIDVLDITVAGDTYTADLHVDPDLSETVTLNLANVPEDSVAWGISTGDLDGLNGSGRLIPMGMRTLDVPAGAGPGSGTLTLSTTAATGEFSALDYFPVVAVELNASNDALAVMDRASRPRNYTATLDSFFEQLALSKARRLFRWNDVENAATGSPAVDVQIASFTTPAGNEVYWEFMMAGSRTSFRPPFLPAGAPASPAPRTIGLWRHSSIGLGYNLPAFDFNDFAFSDILAHASHLAADSRNIAWPPTRLQRDTPK